MQELEHIQRKWNDIIENMKNEFEMTETSYKTWILPLKPVLMENGTLTVLYPGDDGDVLIGYLNKKYHSQIRYSIETITGIALDKNQLLLVTSLPDKNKEKDKVISNSFPSIAHSPDQDLDYKYTFDTFVVGTNNKLAHAASLAVAESPGEKYNPLFLYGGAGLGKTHLMNSIARFIRDNSPEKNVLYISAENFTNEFVESIKNNNGAAFRNKFRNLDVLLVDDIQFMEKRQGTQDEFFHTYEALKNAKKQIVISSDKPPKELTTLEDRLRSRFQWGLAADISSPDFETRIAILRKKEELDGINIDNEVLNYIATNIKTNIRELEGALNKITAYSKLYQKKIDLKTAEIALQDLISPTVIQEVTPDLIVSVVSDHYGIQKESIMAEKRTKNIVVPRQICMYLCREMTNLNWNAIGESLGGKDRTTVMHGWEKIDSDIKTDEILKKTIDIIKKKINPS